MAKDKRTTKPSKQSNKQLSKEFTADDVRQYLKELTYEGHSKPLLEKVGDSLAKNPDIQTNNELSELLQKALPVMNLDNHVLLYNSTTETYKSFLIEFTTLLAKEYNCSSPSEKALVELTASAYIRSIQYTKMLSDNNHGEQPLTSDRNGFYSFLSKEIDRAQRQFVTGLQMLKQLKSPSIPVTIKTTTAFIAQNLQVNSNDRSNDNEINNPK
jgi:hypothetical protein